MKTVLEQYSGTIIAVLVSFSILISTFITTYQSEQGVPALIGSMIERVLELDRVEKGQAFDSYMRKQHPEIILYNPNGIIAGEKINISQCFEAWDGDKIPLEVVLIDIWNEMGESISDTSMSENTFLIESEGRYWIMVRATDKTGYEKEVIAQIFVNKR